ncbi:cryptochrome/photolyase family protein [Pseudoduganella sp. GCM10020061]|uniref:cryptochrome/photolyase family protein n=1 Tax=Pseudoduganella sp. GCM10020061 TaxID=3317345 RepID=UPI00363FE361
MQFSAALVWFRRDLRPFDHAALHHALATSRVVYCGFIFDNAILASLPRTDRRVAFIHASVAALDRELAAMGGHLLVRQGNAEEVLPRLAAELGVDAVFANEDYDPYAIARDTAVAQSLHAAGRRFLTYKDQVVFSGNEVLTQAGKPFSVFTPYKNAWLRRLDAEPWASDPFDTYAHAARLAPAPPGHRIPALHEVGFEPVALEAAGLVPGTDGAAQAFEQFLNRIGDYASARDFPAVQGTSRLSIYLRFGTTSVRHLVRTARELIARGAGVDGARTWLSELIWREFYQAILLHHPYVVEHAFKRPYDAIVWETGPEADAMFEAWCTGRTGYPLVDAAMAQLNQTGFMHNRLRMVTASFLTKDLGIDWRRGEHYFALKLNDYELASNNGGWQWAASTGCDAQPWFRIFNPVTQSERFDPKGDFIRRYIPALRGLDAKQIHAPWTARIPVDGYPERIVVHEEARQKTLERYGALKLLAPDDG